MYIYEERLIVIYQTVKGFKIFFIHFCFGEACTNFCGGSPVCGSGGKQGSEQCDDNNNIPDDGCTDCLIDPGFTCTESCGVSTCF